MAFDAHLYVVSALIRTTELQEHYRPEGQGGENLLLNQTSTFVLKDCV